MCLSLFLGNSLPEPRGPLRKVEASVPSASLRASAVCSAEGEIGSVLGNRAFKLRVTIYLAGESSTRAKGPKWNSRNEHTGRGNQALGHRQKEPAWGGRERAGPGGARDGAAHRGVSGQGQRLGDGWEGATHWGWQGEARGSALGVAGWGHPGGGRDRAAHRGWQGGARGSPPLPLRVVDEEHGQEDAVGPAAEALGRRAGAREDRQGQRG